MVKQIIKNKKTLFMCEVCKLTYKNKQIAQKCQNWCTKNKSCNLEIIKYAIK